MILIEKWKFKISRGNKMATYYEFKKIIGKIFGCGNIEENEDDIDVVIQNRHYPREEANIPDFTISNAELQELYNNVVSTSSENLEFFSENSYEIAIDLDYPSLRRDHYPGIADDTINRIKYTFSFPTMEYCAFLLINIVDIRNRQSNHRGLFPMRLLRPFDTLRRYGNDEEPLSLQSLLPRMIGELSLKIESVERKSLETFRKYKTSFAFQFMYRSGFSLIEFSDIEEMFHLNRTTRERINFEQLDSPPLREYTVDVVDYYKLALSSNDPYIKFISFYHVMEYFYDEVFKKKMITDLRDKITNPGFSYRDDDKIYEMALFVKNRLRMNDESGQGNELESLKFVLNEYVTIDELKNRISSMDSTAITYYQTNKVIFCNAPTIPWTDLQGVYTQIARRIYFTRNSLVHSKSGKNQERYKPYKDEKQLQKEIPLVKAVAELIIINSSLII